MIPDRIIAVRTTKTVFRDDDLTIKMFDSSYSLSDILREASCQAYAAECGLHTPALQEVCRMDGSWAIVSQHIAGKTLSRLMKEEPAQKEHWLQLLAGACAEVHEKSAPGLMPLRHKLHRRITACGLPEAQTDRLLHRLAELESGEVLCHGDLTLSNVVQCADGSCAVLDWSHAAAGCAAADAACSWLQLLLGWDRGCADRFLELYCSRTACSAAEAQAWIPLAAAAQLGRCRPGQKPLLQEVIDSFPL